MESVDKGKVGRCQVPGFSAMTDQTRFAEAADLVNSRDLEVKRGETTFPPRLFCQNDRMTICPRDATVKLAVAEGSIEWTPSDQLL